MGALMLYFTVIFFMLFIYFVTILSSSSHNRDLLCEEESHDMCNACFYVSTAKLKKIENNSRSTMPG